MPRIKGSLRAQIRLLFCLSSSGVVEDDGPEIPLQAQTVATDAAGEPTHSAGNIAGGTQAAEQEPDAPAQSQPVLSTITEPTASAVSPTIEEAKASAKEHSRAFKAMVTTFEGFTALAKLVEPLLEGTPFKAPATVFIAIAEGIEKLKDTREGAEDAMNSLSARMRDVAQHYGDSRNPDSRSMLQEYSRELVEAAQDIDAIMKLSWLGQLRVDANKSKLEGVIVRVDKSTLRFQLRVVLAIERDTKDILDALFKNNLRALNRAPSAQYKADTVRGQSKREACTAGTRVDILERIADWAADPSSPSIFWLSGMAGSGKSTIAYTVCQQFSQGGTAFKAALGASFFCSRQVPELRQLGNIIPTLAYQLSHRSSTFATALKDSDLDVVHVSGEQVDKLLLAPWAASECERSIELSPTLIVIDALDEIDEDKGAELLQSLIDVTAKLQQGRESTRKLKIFVTSRPHPHIVSAGGQLGPDAVYRLESIEKSQGRKDVFTFLKARLHDIPPEHGDLLARLADRADGLFIYAATFARILSSEQASLGMTSKEKLKWLSSFTESPTTSSSSNLDAVHGLYRQVLEEAIPERRRNERLPVLHRIICTQQPLPVDALARILDLDSDDDMDRDVPAFLVKALHAVLYISDADSCVYVYHKSFSDFMLDPQLPAHSFTCNIDAQNAGIARACLRIMQTSLRFNICDLPSSYLLDSEVPDLSQSIQGNILDVPGLEYACRYWITHLVDVPASSESVWLLCECLSEFANEKVLFWLEVANLLKATLNVTDNLRSVSAWLKAQRDASTNLKSTLTTIERLAEDFFWTKASTSTPHLYISCLATVFGMSYDLPDTWRSRFARVPQISCTGIQGQGRVLVNIHVQSSVQCVAFSPDGTHIVSGSDDGFVCIWDASTSAELQKLEGHTKTVSSVAFSPNGARVVSGSVDRTIRIWEASTGAELQKFDGHTKTVSSVAFSPDGTHIVSGSIDRSVRTWDASTGAKLRKLTGHAGYINSVALSSDGARIVSGSGDRSVRVWDALTGATLHKLNGHTGPVTSVMSSPDGTRIASASHDKSVCIWNASTGAMLQMLDGHTSAVSSVAFSQDGTRIVSSSEDNSVHVWDASTGTELQILDGHTRAVNSVAFSPDGTRIVSGSDDEYVRTWDASAGAELQKADGHTSYVMSVAFSPDSRRIVSGSGDESVRIWDALTGAELQMLEGHTDCVRAVAFSPDDTQIVSGSDDKSLRIWDASTGKELQKLKGHTGDVTSVAFSSDGTRIVSGSGSYDQSVRIWDALTGAELQKLKGHTDWVVSVAFSPDGMRVISGSDDKSVRIWDALTGAELQILDGHTSAVSSVAFSQDGMRIVSGSDDKTVRIWDASSGAELLKLDEHTEDVESVALSPDGTHIVSGSGDEYVRIWDASTGAELQKLDGHTSHVMSVAFSPDGTRIVSGSGDESVRIWDVATAKERKATQWRLDTRTGWIVSASSGARLLSVPVYLHVGLYDGKARTLVIHRNGRTRISFSNACMGSDWSKCRL